MARAQKQPKLVKKPRAPSGKSANALGYAKRQSRKPKVPSSAAIADVYEYQPEKVRRASMKLQYEKDELIGAGGDVSGSEDEAGPSARQRGRPRLVGEDEEIGEDEDEEIDSDAAFEESDEEEFAGSNFLRNQQKGVQSKSNKRGKATSSRSVRFADVDLNEDESEAEEMDEHSQDLASTSSDEEEEEGDPEEFIDVLDIMDGRGEPESGDDMGEIERETSSRGHDQQVKDDEDEDEAVNNSNKDESGEDTEEIDSDEDEDGEAEADQPISASEDEGDKGNPSALQELEKFVTNLDANRKRKAPDGTDGENESNIDAGRARKRRLLQERTEVGEENEFAAHVGGGKLELTDLFTPLLGNIPALQSFNRSARFLAPSSRSGNTISAPLPQRMAERLDRQAAYEQTKQEVDKWQATMKHIKEAEHLSFPLQAQPTTKTSTSELAARFKPTTEMESAVDRLLKSANLRDEDIKQTESLKMNDLFVSDVIARRAELAKMREMMFRENAKAKRLAKIKSKTYRKIKKRGREHLAEKLGEGEDDEDENDEEVRMRREVERARERATLRHKNTGKWAKAMKGRGELEEDQRKEINDMLDRGEKLRRKIRGDRGSDEESINDEESDGDDEGAVQRIKANAFEELAELQKGVDGELTEPGKKGKSVFEMKFMKDAMSREQRKVDEMVDDFVREMGEQVGDDDDETGNAGGVAGDDDAQDQPYGTTVQRAGGRVTYHPGVNLPVFNRPAVSLASDTSSVTLKSTDFLAQPETPQTTSPIDDRATPLPSPPTERINPWLARGDASNQPIQKRHEVAIGKNSASAEKSKNKLRKLEKKVEDEKAKARDEAALEIEMSNVMTLGSGSNAAGPSKPKKDSAAASSAKVTSKPSTDRTQDDEDDDSDANSEVDAQEKLMNKKGKRKADGVKAFEQRDLVALAFAGDNVVQEFEEQKRIELEQDAPHEVDTTLPGWGSWGGRGTKTAPPKPHLIKKVAGSDPTTRADYKKPHVIISEKRDKKAAKYLVKDLPFPYTSKAQYERSLETPIGIEWNTRIGFQRATLPKVVKKPGTIISPLEKLV
ncbi:Utp14-domain-containing protein [Wolfiporia cocos MD-104 SS10]|uniref:Utp14-domain-containing protein n=1 Tax=Wolfiporia cocos (strain MD-104) TaxID=742152 RepID=A0A2H3J3D5_WOLCO|nr:Utp14-domain-containing protein [Wolfiporia cocos MD-104 SS10]